MLKRIPLPICGLILAIAGLGNLIQSYSENLRLVLGVIATIMFIVVTIKIVSDFSSFKEEMKNPIIASVISTYSMAAMLLAGYYKPFIGNIATVFWYFAVILQILFMINFTINFVLKFKLEQVFPTWFIAYVGIVIATVTAKNFNVTLGEILFWFGLITYIILLPVIYNRVKKLGLPEPSKPLLAIFAAPGSLLLTGYINLFEEKNIYLTIGLLIVSQIIYLIILLNMASLLKLKFYPSYSGFTFPLVISATGLKVCTGYLLSIGKSIGFFKYIVLIETVIAVIIVLYVFFEYCKFIFVKEKSLA